MVLEATYWGVGSRTRRWRWNVGSGKQDEERVVKFDVVEIGGKTQRCNYVFCFIELPSPDDPNTSDITLKSQQHFLSAPPGMPSSVL